METVEIAKTILDLGLSGILLYFIIVVWKDRKETMTQKDTKIQEKDDYIKGNNEKILDVVKNNTKAIESSISKDNELKTLISSQGEALKTLTQYVYDALKK